MLTVSERLAETYSAFINQERPWDFFMKLGDYLEYVLNEPDLKKVVDKEIAIRDGEYYEVMSLENKSLEELREAEQRLLKIISENNLDVASFQASSSYIPTPHDARMETIVEQMEAFEKGMISLGGFHSDNLQRFLFDLATNLLRLGYEDALGDYVVSAEEANRYFGRINGTDNMVPDERFIFSKTWPERFEKARAIKLASEFESWGSFDFVLKFWYARSAVKRGANFRQILKEYWNETESRLDTSGAIDIGHAAEDFRALMDNHDSSDQGLPHSYLLVKDFRTHAAKVEHVLLQTLSENKALEVKIIATKSPSFTMKTLRPLANLLAKYTSPSQVSSVAREFGFDENATTLDEAAAALLRIFETFREEGNDEEVRKVIETLLTLYAHLVSEKLHEKGLIGSAREILRQGHFNLGFHTEKKEYRILPYEGAVHGAVMRAHGLTDEDFKDGEKRKMRVVYKSNDTHERIGEPKGIGKKPVARFKKGDQIKTIEILNGPSRIAVYINGDYSRGLDFHKGKIWGRMCDLAEREVTDFDKGFLDYFNSNLENPLYRKHGLAITKILKAEDRRIVKNIKKIGLVTKKKISQRLNAA